MKSYLTKKFGIYFSEQARTRIRQWTYGILLLMVLLVVFAFGREFYYMLNPMARVDFKTFKMSYIPANLSVKEEEIITWKPKSILYEWSPFYDYASINHEFSDERSNIEQRRIKPGARTVYACFDFKEKNHSCTVTDSPRKQKYRIEREFFDAPKPYAATVWFEREGTVITSEFVTSHLISNDDINRFIDSFAPHDYSGTKGDIIIPGM